MDKTNTTKELLGVLISQGEEMNKKIDTLSQNYFDVTLQLSGVLNKQDKESSYIRGILEGNNKTHQKGLVEEVQDIKEEVLVLKVDKKVTTGKIVVAGGIFTVIGTVVLKLFGVIKFFV